MKEPVSEATDQPQEEQQRPDNNFSAISAPVDSQDQPQIKPEQVAIDSISTSRCPTPGTPNSEKKMNGLSFSELCCLFCCPPCPGRIAAKLAFLPPEATYSFTPDETNTKFTLNLSDRAEWQYTQRELESIEVFYTRTARNNRIGCM